MPRSYRSRINRTPSKFRIKFVPSFTVILGSMITALPILSDYPILPPMGFLVLLAWRLIRPGYWPMWAGFPLGVIDDIFSGQPFGSAAFLWSVVFIILEILDRRGIGRDYWQDWIIASLCVIFVLVSGMFVVDFHGSMLRLEILIPQILLSILLYPFVTRLIGTIDNWRVSA